MGEEVEKLDLSLPERKTTPRKGGSLLLILLLLLSISSVNLWISLRPNKPVAKKTEAEISAKDLKELALKLERQELFMACADTWREYLDTARLEKSERAKILYRMGKIYQKSQDYEKALESFYRSETVEKQSQLAPEIGRRVQECLEMIGKFAALRYELEDRVEKNKKGVAGGKVVAEIGPEKITEMQLDEHIEREIELELKKMAGSMPSKEIDKYKAQLLKQMSTSQMRKMALEQMVMEEVLYRRAREIKLADNEDVKRLLKETERKILGQKVIDRRLAKIDIGESDLTTWYQAHKDRYFQPARAKISHILLTDEKSGKSALDRIEKGEKFSDLAQEISADKETGKKGGEIEGWIDKGLYVPHLGKSKEIEDAIFSADVGQVAGPVKTEKGWELIMVREKQPSHQKSYEQMRGTVYRELRQSKEEEVRRELVEELKSCYDVVIHSTLSEKEEKEKQ